MTLPVQDGLPVQSWNGNTPPVASAAAVPVIAGPLYQALFGRSRKTPWRLIKRAA